MGMGDDDKGGRRRGGKEGDRASGRATTVAAAPIANKVLVANLNTIADKRLGGRTTDKVGKREGGEMIDTPLTCQSAAARGRGER